MPSIGTQTDYNRIVSSYEVFGDGISLPRSVLRPTTMTAALPHHFPDPLPTRGLPVVPAGSPAFEAFLGEKIQKEVREKVEEVVQKEIRRALVPARNAALVTAEAPDRLAKQVEEGGERIATLNVAFDNAPIQGGATAVSFSSPKSSPPQRQTIFRIVGLESFSEF